MFDIVKIFDSWGRILEVALSAVLFYVLIVSLVRVLGKRTTGQLNNFDWIITITVGALTASGILLDDVAILDAIAAIVVLAMCQYLTTMLVRHSDTASRLVKDRPTLLMHKGEFLREAMDKVRVTESEVLTALRAANIAHTDNVSWVVLENDGTMSVLTQNGRSLDNAPVLENVRIPDDVKD